MQRSLIRPFYPALNGLRAVAILMVFVNHYGALAIGRTIPLMFWPGVDLFFVLSGFLITGILYDSRESERYFRDFYTRRALRIFPLYYGFFVLVRILKPLLHLVYSPLFWSNWLYVSNLVRPWWGNPTEIFWPQVTPTPVVLGALWSLCVEEQFYLVWPLLVLLLRSCKAIM